MSIMTYEEKATEIIKNSIKSAIFIDEKAVDFYTSIPDENILEEKLSKNLFQNFKDNSVSLTVNKFDISKVGDDTYYNYLLKRRDLILLDWKLDNDFGEEYSLEILSKIVDNKSIHFCSIYTSESDTASILDNIRSYFSGRTTEYYSNVKEIIELYDGIEDVISKISYDGSQNSRLYGELVAINGDLPNQIKEVTNIQDINLALIQVKIAFSGLHTSGNELPLATNINETSNILNIKGTIVSIISKDEDNYDKIIEKLKTQILTSPNHFIELLGLDMQALFSDESSFVADTVLNIDFNTLLYHRKQIIKNGSEEEFSEFINSILLEQAKMNIKGTNLTILESNFIRKETENISNISNESICKLNRFYNGSVQSKNRLNFGDIFSDSENNEYYLCITPLCDCLHPENIKNNFFFIKGNKTSKIEEVINSGDSWFKSYITDDIVILWAKGVDYIKPLQLHIENSQITDDNLSIHIIREKELKELSFEYKFSLKNSYAQRIANHAFNHPIRVGVDFMKK